MDPAVYENVPDIGGLGQLRTWNETNEVEPRGRSDGCVNNNEFDQQRRSESRQLLRGQWIQQGGQQEEGRW